MKWLQHIARRVCPPLVTLSHNRLLMWPLDLMDRITSLLTHLRDDDLANYLAESYRVLRGGSTMHMSVFCIEYLRRAARHRRTFEHRVGPAFVADPDRPEAAVAFPEAHLLQRCRQAGFHTVHVEPGGGQHTLVAVK